MTRQGFVSYKKRSRFEAVLASGIPIILSQSTSINITFPSHSEALKFFLTYSYGLHDGVVRLMIRAWQKGQKNYIKVCNETIGIH
jgi:hypothetical protein